jgi:hypothetical protein
MTKLDKVYSVGVQDNGGFNLTTLTDKQIRELFFYLTGWCGNNKEFIEGINAGLQSIGVDQPAFPAGGAR